MQGMVLWGLLNGLITGGVWVGIVLLQRQRRMLRQQPLQLEDIERRLDELERVEQRLAEVEGRLEFAERLLARREDQRPLPPGAADPAN